MADVHMKDLQGRDIRISEAAVLELASKVDGPVIHSADERYEQARNVWNGMIDKRPGLILQCAGVADVQEAVRMARANDLRLTVRGGGHSAAGLAVEDGALVADLSHMRDVRVDAERRIATVDGGARLRDVDRVAQEFGLAAPLGVVSDTGVGGLTLGGGIGWLMRKYGLSIDNLLGAEVVTADGKRVRTDEHNHPDLFWAIRGGGGNFGVVVSFEFRLHPIGPEAWLALPVYSLENAAQALRGYRDYMRTAPEELGSLATLWTAPEEPEIPREFQNHPVLILVGCYTGPVTKGEEIVGDFKSFAEPLADMSSRMSFLEVQQFLDADYPEGDQYYWKSMDLPDLTDDVIDIITRQAATRPSPATSIDVWATDGAVSRVDAAATAFGDRSSPFLLNYESCWSDPKRSEENVTWTREAYEEVRGYSTGGSYLNFPGFGEEGDALLEGSYGRNLERLRRIKATYDPTNLFSGNLNVRPAGS